MVCGVKQHTGKTSVSMALFSNLRELLQPASVGYMKPVGQEWVEVPDLNGKMLRADKDAALAYQFFGLADPMRCVSPVVIGRGDTKAFLDGAMPSLSDEAMKQRLHDAFEQLSSAHDFVVVEGTGHCGVGSVLGWNNARVAATLGIDVVLVANGGIGSTFDDLALNVLACKAAGAKVAGIIVNKCVPGKVGEVGSYLQRASDRFGWDVPIIGCVPYGDGLDKPSVLDLQHLFEGGFSTARYDPAKTDSRLASRGDLHPRSWRGVFGGRNLAAAYTNMLSRAAGFDGVPVYSKGRGDRRTGGGARSGSGGGGDAGGGGGEGGDGRDPAGAAAAEPPPVLLAGAEHMSRRFSSYELVTASLEEFMGRLLSMEQTEAGAIEPICFVAHASRSDIIQGLLGHRAMVESADRGARAMPPFCGGLVISGSPTHRLPPFVEEHVRMARFPVLRSNLPMTQTLAAIKDLTPKMQAEDDSRVRHVIGLYGPHLTDAVKRIVDDSAR